MGKRQVTVVVVFVQQQPLGARQKSTASPGRSGRLTKTSVTSPVPSSIFNRSPVYLECLPFVNGALVGVRLLHDVVTAVE